MNRHNAILPTCVFVGKVRTCIHLGFKTKNHVNVAECLPLQFYCFAVRVVSSFLLVNLCLFSRFWLVGFCLLICFVFVVFQ